MIDKKELDEITQYAKNFDNHHVSKQWDNWKMDLREELDRVCNTEDDLDEIMSVILKQNLSEVAKNLFEGAAEDLTNEKYAGPGMHFGSSMDYYLNDIPIAFKLFFNANVVPQTPPFTSTFTYFGNVGLSMVLILKRNTKNN